MDHHRFLMIRGLWLWAAFRAVGVSWGDHLWCSSNYWTSQRRERERTPFPAFVPSCCCWAFQLRRMQSLEHLGHMFGHRDLEWLHGSLWSRSTPHSACWNPRREPVSTEIGLILFPVCVKQSLLIKNWNFFLLETSKSAWAAYPVPTLTAEKVIIYFSQVKKHHLC